MEKLNNKAKEYLLKVMQQELIDFINKMTIDDLKTEERYKYESFEKELRVGLMLRNEHMLTPEGIELLNNISPENILLYKIIN